MYDWCHLEGESFSSLLLNTDIQRLQYAIVRSMIKLKYGHSQPIHEGLIVEAEVSLGRWMATRRKENVRAWSVRDVQGGQCG